MSSIGNLGNNNLQNLLLAQAQANVSDQQAVVDGLFEAPDTDNIPMDIIRIEQGENPEDGDLITGEEQLAAAQGLTEEEAAAEVAKLQIEVSELDAKIKEIESNMAQAIADSKAKIESPNATIARLEEEIAELEAKAQQLKEEYEEAEAQRVEAQLEYDAKVQEQEELAAEIEQNNAEMEEASQEAEALAQEMNDDYEGRMAEAQAEAATKYDPEKDGDYDDFVQEYLSGIAPDSTMQSKINDLNSQISSLSIELTTLTSKKKVVDSQVSTAKQNLQAAELGASIAKGAYDQVLGEVNSKNSAISASKSEVSSLGNTEANMQAELATLKAEKSTKTARIQELTPHNVEATAAFQSISQAELDLIKTHNIDLSATFEDGTPKYFLAMGKKDNQWHIYERYDSNSHSGATLARAYAPDRGYDIVESGNGYLNANSANNSSHGGTIYNITCYNPEAQTVKACEDELCYSTSSPLSFDLEGDGVTTKDDMIKFDIDADGILDNINDSADAVLVFDADGDGIAGENGFEVFGNNTDLDGDGVADGYKDGFEALKALASKAGLISATDNKLDAADIKQLEEDYGLMIKTDGYLDEAKSLFDVDISEITLSLSDETELIKNFDGKHNDIMTQAGTSFTINGEELEIADLWHAKK